MDTLGNDESNGDKPAVPNEGRPWLQLFIQKDGSMSVHGSIQNKVMAYGLLDVARDAIKDFHDKQAKIERVNHSGGLINTIRGGFKR